MIDPDLQQRCEDFILLVAEFEAKYEDKIIGMEKLLMEWEIAEMIIPGANTLKGINR